MFEAEMERNGVKLRYKNKTVKVSITVLELVLNIVLYKNRNLYILFCIKTIYGVGI